MKLSEYINKYGDCEIDEEKAKELIVEKKGRWKPEYGETYYYISYAGEILKATWENSRKDKYRYSVGKVYQTYKDAEFDREKDTVTQELKDFAKANNEFEIDWYDDDPKYYAAYDYEENQVTMCQTWCEKSNDIYFKSFKKLEKAIETIGEERLKKYYFEVE